MDYSLFQRLSEAELANYLDEIDMALEFHIKWLSRVNRMLICRNQASLDSTREMLSSDDHFWRCYSNITDKEMLRIPAFVTLGKVYTEMLDMSRKLLARAEKNEAICSKGYDRFITLTNDLHQQINALKDRIKSDLNLVAKIMGKVFENAEEGVMITDQHSNILHVNQSFVRVTQYSRDDVLGKKPSILHSGTHDRAFYERMWDELKRTHRWQGELWNRRRNNEIYPEWLTITAVHDDNGDTTHYIGIFSDVSTESEGDERLYHLAHYDSLSNLPNRMLFYDRLRQTMSRARRSQKLFAVMFIDLDDFKDINDRYGHSTGDKVLQQVSKRLSATLRESDTIARIGGDEFTVIVSDIEAIESAALLADKIMQSIRKPYRVDEDTLKLSASIGISLYPENSSNADELVKQADIAMYEAKKNGKNRYQFFSSSIKLPLN